MGEGVGGWVGRGEGEEVGEAEEVGEGYEVVEGNAVVEYDEVVVIEVGRLRGKSAWVIFPSCND